MKKYDELLVFANQMIKEQTTKLESIEPYTDKDAQETGVLIGMKRIVGLIERLNASTHDTNT